MNRVILIGNGFDKAHGLPTSYKDFIDKYWTKFAKKIYDRGTFRFYEDELVKFENGASRPSILNTFTTPDDELNSYDDLYRLIKKHNNSNTSSRIELTFKNEFCKHISEIPSIDTWFDIENEYYCILKSYIKAENKNKLVRKLNNELNQVKELLEKYLTEVCQQDVIAHQSIKEAIVQPLMNNEIGNFKKEMLIRETCLAQLLTANHPDLLVKRYTKESDKYLNNIKITKTLFLNFNYTNIAEKLYIKPLDNIINIHGELNNKNNHIIFGYGDELDDDYKELEKTNNNDFLDNIKSFYYHNTNNYRKLLDFLQDEPYQVFTMGHSCGNSDRTLLNTIFEHPNCISIKLFYYQWKNGDNYMDIYKNISRNFNNKQNMRDIVVNKKYCEPLVSTKS